MTWVATGYAFKDDPHLLFQKGKMRARDKRRRKEL